MGQPQRVSIEQIIDAYKTTGTVWNAARKLGICGQSVWERLKAIDYPMANRKWTLDEIEELTKLSKMSTISEIATALGRPYYAIAIKISRLGLSNSYGNTQKKKVKRGSGFDKANVTKLIIELDKYSGTLRAFSRMKGLELESLVHAIQRYDLDFWKEYSRKHTDIVEAKCPYCENTYHPMNSRQKHCTRKCAADARRDEQYFGGKRKSTIGLAEGICQLCLQEKPRGLSSHHILGKENDPDNNFLIALCPGCHQMVGHLAGRKFTDTSQGWENLITLVMGRRLADKNVGYAGVYACVDVEYLTMGDIEDLDDESVPVAQYKNPRMPELDYEPTSSLEPKS